MCSSHRSQWSVAYQVTKFYIGPNFKFNQGFSICILKVCDSLADHKFKKDLWVENTGGKGQNAGFQHFLLFPQFFEKCLCVLKTQDCVLTDTEDIWSLSFNSLPNDKVLDQSNLKDFCRRQKNI